MLGLEPEDDEEREYNDKMCVLLSMFDCYCLFVCCGPLHASFGGTNVTHFWGVLLFPWRPCCWNGCVAMSRSELSDPIVDWERLAAKEKAKEHLLNPKTEKVVK